MTEPTPLEQRRTRLNAAKTLVFKTAVNAYVGHFDTPVERELYDLAATCWNHLQGLIRDLDLYVGNEPTLAEEAEYVASEADRMAGIEQRLRDLLAELQQGLMPDQISRRGLERRLRAILADPLPDAATGGATHA